MTFLETFTEGTLTLIKQYNIYFYKLYTNIAATTIYLNGEKARIIPSDMLKYEEYENNQVYPSINFISIPNSLFVLTDASAITLKEAYKNPPYLLESRHPITAAFSAPFVTKTGEIDYGAAEFFGYYVKTTYPSNAEVKWLCVDNLPLTRIGTLRIYTTDSTDINHNIYTQYPNHQIQTYFGYILYGTDQLREYRLDYSFWKKYKVRRRVRRKRDLMVSVPSYSGAPLGSVSPDDSPTYETVVEYNDTPITSSPPPSEEIFTYTPDAINPCD